MKKYLKYLILLFLAFGLTANDCTLDSQSKTIEYYQFSNIIHRRELNGRNSKLYQFSQGNLPEKTSFTIPFEYLTFQDIYNLQIRVLLKLRKQLYQKVSALTAQFTFLNELITSKNPS